MDRGAWWATVHGVPKSQTQLSDFHFHSTVMSLCLSTHFIYPFVFQKTVDCMTTMSVPSTLVKCLYLFFDLPHVPEAVGGAQNELPPSHPISGARARSGGPGRYSEVMVAKPLMGGVTCDSCICKLES